ncbi:MAG TPA: outer membrane protein assembly factor BamD [Candidatus Desulfaltia sp.]|nr:outer membrane protein assembly factor BamD [Candidatus Desulfaltia sp.]
MTPLNKTRWILIIALLCGLGAWSCKEKPVEIAPEIAASDEALYKAGQEIMEKDAEKARLYFRQVIDSFPKSFYAQRAKLAIADTYFKKGDESSMILAAAEYREFIHLYPYSPSASYAQYQIAMTFFKKALKPGRDQTRTSQALIEFKKVLTNYPLSEEAKPAQKQISECEERLAAHNFNIGYHYYRRNAFKASTSRLIEILTNFPAFSKMDEVYFYLADSYYKWNKTEESIPYFTKLVTDYPESKYAKKAQNRLAEIDRAGKKIDR